MAWVRLTPGVVPDGLTWVGLTPGVVEPCVGAGKGQSNVHTTIFLWIVKVKKNLKVFCFVLVFGRRPSFQFIMLELFLDSALVSQVLNHKQSDSSLQANFWAWSNEEKKKMSYTGRHRGHQEYMKKVHCQLGKFQMQVDDTSHDQKSKTKTEHQQRWRKFQTFNRLMSMSGIRFVLVVN